MKSPCVLPETKAFVQSHPWRRGRSPLQRHRQHLWTAKSGLGPEQGPLKFSGCSQQSLVGSNGSSCWQTRTHQACDSFMTSRLRSSIVMGTRLCLCGKSENRLTLTTDSCVWGHGRQCVHAHICMCGGVYMCAGI